MIHADEQTDYQSPVVLLIMGSTRAGRICPRIADWVAQIGGACTGSAYEVVDLADWPLPMDDEPGIPALGTYMQPHTRAWSERISSADAVVFVTPQYNWGYPAPLKNAIDHLYREWHGKPVAIISYGGHGGGKCAEQLKQVAAALKMGLVATSPVLTLSEDVIRHGAMLNPENDLASYVDTIKQAFQELMALITPSPMA
jgi:NAD(P)H-dependent FMN reductase